MPRRRRRSARSADHSALHKFINGPTSEAFEVQEMGAAGTGSLEHGDASGDVFWIRFWIAWARSSQASPHMCPLASQALFVGPCTNSGGWEKGSSSRRLTSGSHCARARARPPLAMPARSASLRLSRVAALARPPLAFLPHVFVRLSPGYLLDDTSVVHRCVSQTQQLAC